jgi:hypothetical protein
MGLSMRLNLFHQVTPEDVYAALDSFYRQRGRALVDHGDSSLGCALHEQDRGWTLLYMPSEHFQERRQLQVHISGELHCRGFLVEVHDGDFWGYEFSSNGEALDQFIQHPDHLDRSVDWFPGESCAGNVAILAEHFPGLERDVLERYLVRYPAWEEWRNEKDWKQAYNRLREERNVKARPEDTYLPFDECAVLDFLRYVGVNVELEYEWVTLVNVERRIGCVRFAAPVWRQFWVSGQNTKELWKEKRRQRRQGGAATKGQAIR